MDNKQLLIPALAIGVGLGIATAHAQQTLLQPTLSSSTDVTPNAQFLEAELLTQVFDGRESNVTFSSFPYYLSEHTRVLLTNAAYVHLKQLKFSKHTRNLSPASRTVLITGPPGIETYHLNLAKALAHYFEAKILMLDITDFSIKIQSKCGIVKEMDDSLFTSKYMQNGMVQRLLGLARTASINAPSKHITGNPGLSRTKSCSDISGALKRAGDWAFEDKNLVIALYRVLTKQSKSAPVILYLHDVEKLIYRGPKTISLFNKMINKLSGPVFILGSVVLDESPNNGQGDARINDKLSALFPYKVEVRPPQDNAKLISWKSQLQEDLKSIQAQDNRNHISEVLAANDVVCEELDSLCFTDTVLVSNYIQEIVVSAISHHLMNTDEPQYSDGRLVISPKSLAHGLNLFQAGRLVPKDTKLQAEKESQVETKAESKTEAPSVTKSDEPKPDVARVEAAKKDDNDLSVKKPSDADVGAPKKPADSNEPIKAVPPVKETPPDNEFEKRIRPEIIPAGEVGVSFKDIGALDNIKDLLHEVVMLPLQRPELFSRGGLIKPCKGILLFGPPGTGKTMLAKAVATEAGASFINVSMSTITSKWFGEDEKNVKALFTLAAKVAPTIIFIDEVDSMLGQRSRAGEHEAMRKIKNEFMAHWDGLLSKPGQRVLVLAATNRPFDLDDAIIRRFERRIMVDLPDKENRERILRAILEKENLAADVDFGELAVMTEGYSGSDLRNLCTVAAYRPLREMMKTEQQKKDGKNPPEQGKSGSGNSLSTAEAASKASADAVESLKPEALAPHVLSLRPINMEDMKEAKNQISSSFAAEGSGMTELRQWNELYGEGGSRKKQQLTYFL